MAARLEKELSITVDRVKAGYGEYRVLVDGETVVDGGARVVIGVMPSARMIVEKVRRRLGS